MASADGPAGHLWMKRQADPDPDSGFIEAANRPFQQGNWFFKFSQVIRLVLYFLWLRYCAVLNSINKGKGRLERQTGNNQLETAPDDGNGGLLSMKERTDPDPGKESDPEVYADEGLRYDVFLSFRGTDYRQSFIDCLYHRLDDAGVCTFKDDLELPVGGEIGPELMKAIKQSKISIPIFSKDYASSKWCLKEVAEMVKRMDERKHMIMPIFLDVTPNEVQHQTGSYKKAFSQHDKKYDSETVKEWRDALQKVVKLKGLELKKEANGNQGEFIKLVLARILNSLKKGHVHVNEQILVALDHKTEALERLLEVGRSGVKIVGIWGMGGIGKTTLAKVVYNQMLDQFASSCFLSDIRETESSKGLPYLQSKLVSGILNEFSEDFANVDEGIQQLKCRLGGKKAIILLDDVDHVYQLNGLAGSLDWFGPGSRIIITTRDKEVLQKFEVNNIYEVLPLSEDQGFELFCKHAFLKGSPTPDFIDLARDIVRATGMLPLTLEVIGSFLSTKIRRKAWQDTLKKLLRAKPEKAVQNRLELSYDDLGDTEKNIFLDIACIFIGMDSRTAIPMWDDRNWFPHIGIEILVCKSLIKITDENKFWMHDQIRDLGREIVERESYNHPGSRSRLWRPEEANDVLKRNEGTAEVEAISLGDGNNLKFEYEGDHFRNLSKLKILRLGRATLGGKFKGLLPELRLLSWKVSLDDPIPTNLDLRNLISLELSESLVSEDWGGWRLMKVASKLKVLDLSGCRFFSTTPDFSSFPALERLVLRGCAGLDYIDSSVGQLSALVSLDLRDCVWMRSLPNLEHLTNLEELYLGGSNYLFWSVVPGLQGLISLETLKLGRSNVTHLDGLEMLEQLRELEIHRSPIERLPNLSKLKRLTDITLARCEKLRQVEGFEELESLERLTILSCKTIVTLPDLSKLRKLKWLILSHCNEITEIRGLGHLESLEILAIERLSNLREIAGLEELENLETLILSKWRGIDKLLELSKLQGLKSLHVLKTEADREKYVVRKKKYDFGALANLPNMSNLRRLRNLKIEGLSNLTEIVGLEGLDNLETLAVRECGRIKKLPDLPDSGSLECLEIVECRALENLPNMSKLRRLREFKISALSSYHLREIVGLEGLANLQRLIISKCEGIEKLPDLSKLCGLKMLALSDCYKITEVRGLGELESLEEIIMYDCEALGGRVLDLSRLRRLKFLQVVGMTEPPEIVGLEGLDDLESLEVSWFGATRASLRTALGSRLDVSRLSRLWNLTLQGLGNLVEVVGLGNLKCLQDLRVSECPALEKLPDVAKLRSLEWLHIDGCDNLTGIGPEELQYLESLQSLSIRGCNKLTPVEFEKFKRTRKGKEHLRDSWAYFSLNGLK